MGSASSALQRLHSTQIKAAILHALEVSLAGSWISNLALPISSDKEIETYIDLGSVPRMTEWKGKRPHQELRELYFQIRNRKYALGLQIMVDDLRRDAYDKIRPKIEDLGHEANGNHWEELATQLIVDAETALCYDGQAFFDTDHAEDESGSQSNDITSDISAIPVAEHGTTTEPSISEMERSIFKGIAQLFKLKDDKGRPINGGAKSFVVMAPAALMAPTVGAVSIDTLENGTKSLLRSSGFNVTAVINPWLDVLGSWTDKFAVFRADGTRKPFIKQEELGVQVQSKAEGSEYEYDNDAHQYGVKAIRAMGYNDYKGSILVTLT